MARYIGDLDPEPLFKAARHWVDRCMVEDGSALGSDKLWTSEYLTELDEHFVKQPDAGSGTFYEKLNGQLQGAPPQACCLMAELLWVLLLFPSNIHAKTKRDGIRQVWSWSGKSLEANHPLLTDEVLSGIGSGGMGVNNHRWREIVYIVGFAQHLKAEPDPETRRSIFGNYDAFMDWIGTVPPEGGRQFPHMLRYLLFPERVERMSSNRDRKAVLKAFGSWNEADLAKLSDRELDDELLKLRQQKSEQYGTEELDFYEPPLKSAWKDAPTSDPNSNDADDSDDHASGVHDRAEALSPKAVARNEILYGPPGTGKTYKLQELRKRYTDQPADVDRASWEHGLVADFGWRAIIVAAMADTGHSVKVNDLIQHPLIVAKAGEKRRVSNINATLWSCLQQHADPASETVNTKIRREPYLFVKSTASEWSLVPDWTEQDSGPEHLLQTWRQGPAGGTKPIERYRMVTFHPSYSYEDFVIGLRPVEEDVESEAGAAGFKLVPGVFVQICATARANPGKRYALFIDEINRADIAKVFGELITLIEPDKRAQYDSEGRLIDGIEVQLPGTGTEEPRFGVPSNLDIYGTMNTADRSIALLDIALRRRFQFTELAPDYTHFKTLIEGINLGRMLKSINHRLEYLLDRDHRIGHAYLMNVKSLDELQDVFRYQIIPLLQEFFFDDWSRIALVLANSSGSSAFVSATEVDGRSLFGRQLPDDADAKRMKYKITSPHTWTANTFIALYEPTGASPDEAS